jgi:hypothetical protein
MQKWLSRKLIVALGSILMIAGSAMHGDIGWTQAVWSIVPVVMTYLGVQGVIDHKAASK